MESVDFMLLHWQEDERAKWISGVIRKMGAHVVDDRGCFPGDNMITYVHERLQPTACALPLLSPAMPQEMLTLITTLMVEWSEPGQPPRIIPAVVRPMELPHFLRIYMIPEVVGTSDADEMAVGRIIDSANGRRPRRR